MNIGFKNEFGKFIKIAFHSVFKCYRTGASDDGKDDLMNITQIMNDTNRWKYI